MIRALIDGFRRLRRRLSRNETMVRWLGLSQSEGTADQPGLVMIQVDGLAFNQLTRALRKRRMPFLRKLIRKRGYELHTMYSGLPSSTPAVQAEIFYGVRCAVPAFGYRDAESGKIIAMFDNAPACRVEQRLNGEAEGLLTGGSAYSNIYSGGAAEPHFCAVTMGWHSVLQVKGWQLLGLVAWHAWSIVRIFTLMMVELVLAIKDVIHGQIRGRNLARELKTIPSRVGVAVGLRELMTIGASIDVTRGLPIVQLNFLGYDEQSHRRGPGSAFAHWSLLGIDDAIKRIFTAARRSNRRKYSVWIYSDHGQERVTSYRRRFHRTIQQAVAEVFGQDVISMPSDKPGTNHAPDRAKWLKRKNEGIESTVQDHDDIRPAAEGDSNKVEVASLGPIGHVYVPYQMTEEQRKDRAQAMVREAGVPLVAYATGKGQATVLTKHGDFELPADAAKVFGESHPFLADVAQDFVCLVHHPCAGDLVLGGFSSDEPPLTFAEENGAHAGPGLEETRAFVLTPADVQLSDEDRGYLRPSDLRSAAMRYLGREERSKPQSAPAEPPNNPAPNNIAPPLNPLASSDPYSRAG